MVGNGSEPARPHVIEKQLQLVLVLLLVLVDGEREADALEVGIRADFVTCDVLIQLIFCREFFKSEVSNAARSLRQDALVRHKLLQSIRVESCRIKSKTIAELLRHLLELLISDEARYGVRVEGVLRKSHYVNCGSACRYRLLEAE